MAFWTGFFFKLNGRSLRRRNLNLSVLINSSVKKQFTKQNDENLRYWTRHGAIREKHEVSISHNYCSIRTQLPLNASSFSAIIKYTFTFYFTPYQCHAALSLTCIVHNGILISIVTTYLPTLTSDPVAQLVSPLDKSNLKVISSILLRDWRFFLRFLF